MDRNEAIKRIKAGLKARSGKSWSVTGGRGTAWGWLRVTIPPARCTYDWDGLTPAGKAGMYPSLAERQELAKLLGLTRSQNPRDPSEIPSTHPQGECIPSGGDYRIEYVDRAEGREPTKLGRPYWD